MPKNVFEIMPILMSLTFWPKSLGFFQHIWYLTRSLSREILSSLSCIYMGVYYLPKVKLSLFFFIQKRILLLFAFYFCVKSKFQELWGFSPGMKTNPLWVRCQLYSSILHRLALWVALFIPVRHLEASRIHPAMCLSGSLCV